MSPRFFFTLVWTRRGTVESMNDRKNEKNREVIKPLTRGINKHEPLIRLSNQMQP